jgi:hypothetical protein
MEFRLDKERDEVLASLQAHGVASAVSRSGSRIGMSVLVRDFEPHADAIVEALRRAEIDSRSD